MANPQIGWSVQAKLLNKILQSLKRLTSVTAALPFTYVVMTQAEYDLITPDPSTFYLIIG